MKVRLTLATCGTCGKRRGITHTCVTRATSRRRTSIKPKVTVTCGRCGRRRGVRHACTIRTDFRKRRRQQARNAKTAERRKRRAEARRKRAAAARARKAAARTRPKRPRPPAHNYETCSDPECERYACRVYRDGFDDGVDNCPRPHGVA